MWKRIGNLKRKNFELSFEDDVEFILMIWLFIFAEEGKVQYVADVYVSKETSDGGKLMVLLALFYSNVFNSTVLVRASSYLFFSPPAFC